MAFRAPSAKEMAENSNFPTLPEDEYLGTVTSYEFQAQKPNPFGDPRDQYLFKIRLESFADGTPLEDTKGEPVKGDFTLNAFIDHNRIGMVPQPAKARKFFAALLRQPVGDEIQIENFPDDLIGKTLYVATVNKPGKEAGVEFTRPADYRPIKIERKRRGAGETTEATEAPKSAGVELDEDDIQF
jgi:hypothetical protein